MTEVSVKNQVKKLVDLQKIDSQRYELKDILKTKPELIESLRQEYERKKATLKQLEERLKENQVTRKGLETEMQAKEGDIAKANSALNQLKTNKEYQAKITEINSMRADKSVLEEKILISFEEAEKIQKEIEAEKTRLTEDEKRYQEGKKEAEAEIKEVEDKLKVLDAQRQQATEGIDREVLGRYERILDNRRGLAMVPVIGNACGGCYMTLPPQVINELKMHEKVIFCESCARILYLEDDL